MTIFGWDASDYDWGRGPMDLNSAKAAGISFFTHKATEATSVVHSHYGDALNRAKSAGIPFLGAYIVVRSGSVEPQVDYFLRYVTSKTPWWKSHDGFFFQVDLEKWPYDNVAPNQGVEACRLIEQKTGKRALLYASKGQYGGSSLGGSGGPPLWNANYALNYTTGNYLALYGRAGGDSGPGWTSYGGRMPVVWQYTSSAVIGRQNTCDANAFRGSLQDFANLIRGKVTPAETQSGLWDLVDVNTLSREGTVSEQEVVLGLRQDGTVRLQDPVDPNKPLMSINPSTSVTGALEFLCLHLQRVERRLEALEAAQGGE